MLKLANAQKEVRNLEVLAPYFTNSLMQVILILVVVDSALGIVISSVIGKFKPAKLAHFLHDSFFPYVLVFVVVEIISDLSASWAWLTPVVFVLIVLTLLANTAGNAGKLGLPVPKFLQKD